jgi:hypothetical protein
MADQNVNAVGCLGRVLTFFGVVWIAIIVLGGMGLLSDAGFSGEFLAGFGGSIIPGLLLLGAGRALRRRAAALDDQSVSTPTPDQLHTEGSRVPSIRLEPTPAPPRSPTPTTFPIPPTESTPPKPSAPKPPAPKPRPVDPMVKTRGDVAKSIESALSGLEEASDEPTREESAPFGVEPGRHKTSQELVDEARRRWGVDRPR